MPIPWVWFNICRMRGTVHCHSIHDRSPSSRQGICLFRLGMNQYRDISLVPRTDTRFRCFCHRYSARYRARGKRNRLAADYTRRLSDLEDAFRFVLACYYTGTENRILRYIDVDAERGESERYKEIDFVGMSDAEPGVFFETKFREKYNPVRADGVGQLCRTLDVARCRWEMLQGVCINIYTGVILGLATAEPEGLASMERVAGIVETSRDRELPIAVWLSGVEFVKIANIRNGALEKLRKSRTAAMDSIAACHREKQRQFGSIAHVFDVALS
jgi:hypothetical protein